MESALRCAELVEVYRSYRDGVILAFSENSIEMTDCEIEVEK